MSHETGKKLNGIRTIQDIMDRSRIDEETGCWNWAYTVRRGIPRIWCGELQECINGGAMLHWIKYGRKPPKKQFYYAKCGNTLCVNPEHRKLGTQSAVQKLHSDHPMESRARMALTHRKRTGTPPETIEAVKAATGTLAEIGAEHGMSPMRVWRIRTGQRWGALQSASVFNYRP